MDLMKIIKERRSIRKYKPDQISDDDLKTLLDSARWAPSWANTQCWEFIVVQDSGIKKRLSATLSPRNPATSAITEVPIIIVACAHLKKSGYFKGKPGTDKGDWFMFDVALALQNLVLMAHTLGLGTVHVGFFDAQEVARIIELPEEMAAVEMVPVGYPAAEAKAPPRKELEEIVSYNKFGYRTP